MAYGDVPLKRLTMLRLVKVCEINPV